jgi:hypothetical protein
MEIGKIVKSYSHINYVCHIYGPREVEQEPAPADYAFGRFVRIALRSERARTMTRASWPLSVKARSRRPMRWA